MTDRDLLGEIKAQLASVDDADVAFTGHRVRSLGPNLTRVYLDWLVAEVERLRGLLEAVTKEADLALVTDHPFQSMRDGWEDSCDHLDLNGWTCGYRATEHRLAIEQELPQ